MGYLGNKGVYTEEGRQQAKLFLEASPADNAFLLKRAVQLPRQPLLSLGACFPTHTLHIENQEHTQQVANPEKSIAQGDIIDELQTSCLSAGIMDWIRDFFYHAGFSKEDMAPKQRCLNTWSALKTNIDWSPAEKPS